jgi:hypothetical protein
MVTTLLTLLTFLSDPAGQSIALAPWSSNHHPTDIAKQETHEFSVRRAEYVVVQGGTMDGRNCRSPQGVWQPFQQSWESNRCVIMENVGQTDLVNPWLSNGHNDFRTLGEIVATAVKPGMTDREKALSLWWQEVQHRFHSDGDNDELLDPVKVFNIYGYNTCGNDSISLAGQWKKAGMRVAPARLVGHCVSQVFYDDRWHLMDGDMHSIYLLRDNQTIAGEQDLVRDHDLLRRTHTQGMLEADRRAGDEWESSIYVFEGPVKGDRNTRQDTAMNMTLRPGERLTWRWGHESPIKYHGQSRPRFPDRICNGLWEYHPDFTQKTWRRGATTVEAIKDDGDGLTAEEGRNGTVVWSMRSPYIFVGGKLEIDGADAKFAISWDGRAWEDAGVDLGRFFPPAGPAHYVYYLRCQLSGQARLRGLRIVNDLQMAPLTLPGMGIGTNEFTYTDQSAGDSARVRLTHQWVERSASRPPTPPQRPIFPPHMGETDGTDIAFQWAAAVDPDGDAIADYQFELSDQADMKWPLSMSFAKLISRTADAGQARYTLAGPGLLNPDCRYFCRVRAQDNKGVWGRWSDTWTFVPRGPAPPIDVTLEFDPAHTRGVLRWSPNSKGRQPVAYSIYASDEKGFSISDKPYAVTVGISRTVPAEFPANFVVETTATEREVVGTQVELAGANKAFYRVVAVDSTGKRSGPSDVAASIRPVVFSKPVTSASKGVKYRYRVAAIRSLGDLRTRVVGGKETMSFWDVERLRFKIESGPAWLSIDELTGLLSGTPDHGGRFEVAITALLEREEQRLDESALTWGIEKVVASGTMSVGSASQRFVIDVGP